MKTVAKLINFEQIEPIVCHVITHFMLKINLSKKLFEKNL